MPYFEFTWDPSASGNIAHLAEHDVSPDEAEQVVMNPIEAGPNRRHPDRVFAKGYTVAGRKLGVSYVRRDEATVYVITAFEVE